MLESVLCASPAYLAAHGTPTHPRELQIKHLIVQYANPHTARIDPVVYSRRLERVKVNASGVLTVNESTTLVAAALSDLGLVHIFEFLARASLARGTLVAVLPEWRTEATPVYVVYPPTRHPSARLRAFIDWVASMGSGTH